MNKTFYVSYVKDGVAGGAFGATEIVVKDFKRLDVNCIKDMYKDIESLPKNLGQRLVILNIIPLDPKEGE